jgi:acyl-CoA synthetase (AMP-forming)/AMP-acid ligase II
MEALTASPQLLRDWIDRAARRHPEKPCIVSVEDGRTLTYEQLRQLASRIAAHLRGRGVRANDRVALLAENSIEHLACYFGVMAYGATICTIHVEMNRHHLGRILPALNPRLILFEEGLGLDDMFAATSVPALPLGSWDSSRGVGFYAAIGRGEADDSNIQAPREQSDAVIFFTSGTSDRPKGAVLTFRELLCNAIATADAFGIRSDDRIYDFRSYNWCSAQVLSALAPLYSGATQILGRKI